MLLRISIWALCCASAFAGQSIALLGGRVASNTIPAQAPNSACRVEFSIHDWDLDPPNISHAWEAAACGFNLALYNFGKGDLRLQLYSMQTTGGQGCLIRIGVDAAGKPVLPSRFVTVRFQRDPSVQATSAASGTSQGGIELCEGTDVNGKTYWTESHAYTGTSGLNSPGAYVGGTGLKVSTAYFRLFTTLVPLGSRPPVTADKGDLLEWKFDSNLGDSSGRGFNAEVTDGTVAYTPTPGQDLVVAKVNTLDSPAWSSWVSMRVGFPNQIDCSHSYSQADASADVTCNWSMVNGPSTLTWSSQTVRQPTLTNIEFGTYNIQLKVTDVTGTTSTQSLGIGAVAYDDNGVVIPSDPKITEIFGPMIAFGQNPWGYADERAKRMVELQNPYFLGQRLDHPAWQTNGQGTISYSPAGKGQAPARPCTTLAADITAQQLDIPVADASCLSLDGLPTWIVIGNSYGSLEMIRIVSTTARTGPATLTAAYDGRGLTVAEGPIVPAKAWSQGTTIGEFRIEGSQTLFVTDPNVPLCPAGAPGPAGAVVYSQGTVLLAKGSKTIAGSGTAWTTANNVIGSYSIRVTATHGGGEPFVYWAVISSVDNPTQMTVTRPLPPDVDEGPFPYKITSYRYFSLHFPAPDGSDQNMLYYSGGCESETAAFAIGSHDIPLLNDLQIKGARFSYKDNLGIQSPFGPNFYGSGLAARAFYFRSGWDFAKVTADIIDERWVKDPEIAAGWTGGIPLLQGGGVVGAMVDLITNPSTSLTWNDVRRFAVTGGFVGSTGCNNIDSRDSGYYTLWVALAANYDPDSAQRANWKARLAEIYARDVRCKQSDGSWSNGFLYNPAGSPPLTVTRGSATVTGTNLPSSLCYGIASGTVLAISGSHLLTVPPLSGDKLVPGNKIVISGTRGGLPYVGAFQFSLAAGTAGLLGTLAVDWPGDTGAFSYVIENNDALTTIAENNDDPQLTKNWACTWKSSSEITLNRPWDGPSSSNEHMYSYALAGFGQQPYMLGIKLTAMQIGSQSEDATIAAGFAALAAEGASWIHDVGYDPNTQGLHYGRGFELCEPLTTAAPETRFDFRTPGCNYGLNPAAVRASRVLTAEASSALRVFYEYTPTRQRKEWGDRMYGSIWGYCPYTKPGYYCDESYVRDENSDLALGAYKWPGFFFGMGMAHQWPAVRALSVPSRR